MAASSKSKPSSEERSAADGRNEPYLTFSLGYEHVFVKKKR